MKTKNKLLKEILTFIFLVSMNYVFAQTNTSPTQTVCAGSLAEPYLINPPTSGSTYQWTISGGGIINPGITSDNITVDWGFTPGTYIITVLETDINGCQGTPVTVDVTVNALPTATTATNQTACFGGAIPALTAIGANVTWYSDAGLTNIVGTGNTFSSNQTAVGLYTYYVTDTDINGCESNSSIITLEILSAPSSPLVVNQTACFGGVIPDLTAIGANVTWYSDAGLTNIVGTGNTFSSNQSAVGIYTYYVTESLGLCESTATLTTLEIYSVPNTGPINHW